VKFISTSLVAFALALAATQVAMPATTRLVVHATIWPNLDITFSPKAFRHGSVVMEVKNRSSQAHQFSINGVTSPQIRPHGIVAVTVTFKRRATYTATLADCGYPFVCAGANPDLHPMGNVKVT
jgi:hypothetical protein